MKILQVAGLDSFAYKFLLPLIDSLIEEGHTVETACCCTERGTVLRDMGYVVHHIPMDRNLNITSHLANTWRLARLFKKGAFDCVHAHNPVASLIARLAGRIAGVPVVIYTAHGFYFHET